MNLVYPNEVTPPEGHAIVQKLAAEINSDCVLEKVEIGDALMERFHCYYNVAHVVQEKGGEAVLGWAFLWWPHRYGVLTHHAVWKRPDGVLIDVTEPQISNAHAAYILFAADDSIQINLERHHVVGRRFVVIQDSHQVQGLIRVERANHARVREQNEILWELGYRCEAAFAKAAGMNYSAADALTRWHEVHPRLAKELNNAHQEYQAAVEGVLAGG